MVGTHHSCLHSCFNSVDYVLLVTMDIGCLRFELNFNIISLLFIIHRAHFFKIDNAFRLFLSQM